MTIEGLYLDSFKFSLTVLHFILPVNIANVWIDVVALHYQRFELFPAAFGMNAALGSIVLWFYYLQEAKVR